LPARTSYLSIADVADSFNAQTLDAWIMSAQPLTDAEFDRLAEVLQRCGGQAMNIEMLDGFLAALICGPETVLPSEYLPKIWGGDQTNDPTFDTQSVVREFLSLIMCHWNAVCHSVQSDSEFFAGAP
jgi:yecA family protein